MEVAVEVRPTNTNNSGITLKEASAITLAFFALQFTVLAIAPADSGVSLADAWSILVANAVAATGVVIAARFLAGKRFTTNGLVGVGVAPISARTACACLFSGMLTGLIIVGLVQVFHYSGPADPVLAQTYLEGGIAILLAWSVSLILVAPLSEELICRGFILPALSRKLGVAPAVILSAALFLLVHLPQIDGYWVAAAGIFSMGIVAGVMRVRTGSLFGAVAVHAGYNAIPLTHMLWTQFVS